MKEREMEEISHMMVDAYRGKNVKNRVKKMAEEFY